MDSIQHDTGIIRNSKNNNVLSFFSDQQLSLEPGKLQLANKCTLDYCNYFSKNLFNENQYILGVVEKTC
jgi:hypothetical protein